MPSQNVLRKYAKLAVLMGVNVQKNQLLIINCPVECAYFARLCVEESYLAGAEEVRVKWSDEFVSKASYLNVATETLKVVPPHVIAYEQEVQDRKCCYLHIDASTPGYLADIDPMKMQEVAIAQRVALNKFQGYTMGNKGQWSIVALPNEQWAIKVFPNCSVSEAVEKLWDAILTSVRISEDNDPVELWKIHNQTLMSHNQLLNDHNFKSLHFKNAIGTDLNLELVEEHVWAGGCEFTTSDILFNPNMPTEETFCMPNKLGVNGKVVATKPLNYQGKLVEDFWLRFENGKVVEYDAKKGKDALENLLKFDEGSCYLGEVALISHDSPISNSKILFLNTLFDENASCHLALGNAYPMNIKGGTSMSEEELLKKGYNKSMTHVDFMFGNENMEIVGTKHDGSKVIIFEKGNFII